jgi:SAM-dependent methyltransferase
VKWLTRIHGPLIHGRRIDRLAAAIAPLVPTGSTVGDIGAGDGALASAVLQIRPDLAVRGVDVLQREETAVPVELYDGDTLPWATGSLDWTLLVDVLHHAVDPSRLLAEARRVSRVGVIIKDHYAENANDQRTLALMDWFGNAGYGVPSLFRYWSRSEWSERLSASGLHPERILTALHLYPMPLDAVFGRGLHFVAKCRAHDNL